ncbi:hypothetical protein CI102_11469 [Trichoderma harzianum]|nr:hypothetical protein CI102_11469 [Trichoderma harzianum]
MRKNQRCIISSNGRVVSHIGAFVPIASAALTSIRAQRHQGLGQESLRCTSHPPRIYASVNETKALWQWRTKELLRQKPYFGPGQMASGYHGSAAALTNLGVWIGPTQPTRLITCGLWRYGDSNQKEPQLKLKQTASGGFGSFFDRKGLNGGEFEKILFI